MAGLLEKPLVKNRPAFSGRIRKLAASKAGADAARRNVLERLKSGVAKRRRAVERKFIAKDITGLEAAQRLSDVVDELFRLLLDAAAQTFPAPAGRKPGPGFAAVATGGYGRRQLAFFSDIDVLFLIEGKPGARVEKMAAFILEVLWDLGLTVGHAVRTPAECIKLAKDDPSIKAALLDARHVAGGKDLFARMWKMYRKQVMAGGARKFVEERLGERDRRHRKWGNSRYVVEPNLKESKGGLRDLHTLYWMARFLYGVEDMAGLEKKKILRRDEVKTFARAERFLWDVRQHLHLLSGRAEDRLTFDVQVALAKKLGYRDRPGMSAPERFMKHYFWIAKTVGDLTRIFCAFLEARHQKKGLFDWAPLPRKSKVDSFRLEGERLNFASAKDLQKDPAKMVRIFAAADRHGCDIHPDALRLMSRNLHLIDTKLKRDPEANDAFLAILTSRKDPETNLRRMNEAGVLGRLIPDFGRVVAQTQHDMYHYFTVDEHTIRAIGLLAKIEKGELDDVQTLGSSLVGSISSRPALYLALFLHDIAKGRGGDHSEIGAGIARVLGPRLGFTPAETDLVAWLVKNHLLMSKTAFKRDLSDPKTIRDFTGKVGTLERLRLLTLLTIPDIMAVGPNIWNSWKHRLLSDLYSISKTWLSRGANKAPLKARVREKKKALKKALAAWPEARFRAVTSRFPEGYWISDTTEAQARDARLVANADRRGEEVAVEIFTAAERGFVRISVYADATPELVPNLSGALASHSINIIDARVFTLEGGKALASFMVENPEEALFATPGEERAVAATLKQAGRGDMSAIRVARPRPLLRDRTAVFTVEPRVRFDNEVSTDHTVLEVKARDRVGLLHDLTGIMVRHGCAIFACHIATYGARAADVFYIQDQEGRKITDKTQLKALKGALEEALLENERLAERAAAKAG